MDYNLNLSIEQDIHWLDVFKLEEVHEYLTESDFKELCSVSRLFRSKLKPMAFKYIMLEGSKLSSDICYFGLSNDSRAKLFTQEKIEQFEESQEYQNSLNRPDYKALAIDPYLKSMKSELENFSTFVERCRFYKVHQPCYYLIDLIELTTNLTSLEIDTGSLLLKDFQKTLNSIQHLKELTLKEVLFVKFKSDNLESNALSLPKTLQKLSIDSLWLIERYYRKGAYQLLFGNFSIYPIPLPIVIEHLPKLEYFNCAGSIASMEFVLNIIKFNTQIQFLTTPFDEIIDNLQLAEWERILLC